MSKAPFLYGVLGKAEGSYGAGATLAAADDGIFVVDDPQPDLDYLFDGSRGQGNAAPGTAATLVRAIPNGLGATAPIVQDFSGPGIAYSSTVASIIDLMMKASGHLVVVDTTVSAEKITYTPINDPNSWVSHAFEIYTDGEKTVIDGGYADFSIGADGPVVPTVSFDLMGIGVLPTETALPAITYPANTQIPPGAINSVISIGSYVAGVVRSWQFSKNQSFSPRANQNTAGHGGFAPGRRNPTLEVTVEKTALVSSPFHTTAGLDPRNLRAAGTLIALSLQVGTVQYKMLKLAASNAQLVEVADDDDGDVGLWVLTFELKPSTPAGTNDYSWVTD